MDLGLGLAITITLVNIVLIGIGIYITQYIKSKANILATNENFEELLKQTKETTKITKQIENNIGNEAWLLKQKWEIKKEFYIEALGVFNLINKAFETWFHLDDKIQRGKLSQDKCNESEQEQDVAFDTIQNQMSRLDDILDLTGELFLDKQIIMMIRSFTNAENKRRKHILDGDGDNFDKATDLFSFTYFFHHLNAEFDKAYASFKEAARLDLNMSYKGE